MPRYFFHVINGGSGRDAEGTELADIYQAQTEAIRLSGALLMELGGKFWDGTEWKLDVCDDGGRLLFGLRFAAEEYPDLKTAK